MSANRKAVPGGMNPAMVGSRRKPSCGHSRLMECPLTTRDWESVFFAYIGFMQTCRLISEAAHERADKRGSDRRLT